MFVGGVFVGAWMVYMVMYDRQQTRERARAARFPKRHFTSEKELQLTVEADGTVWAADGWKFVQRPDGNEIVRDVR